MSKRETWGEVVDDVLGKAKAVLVSVVPNPYASVVTVLVDLLRTQLKKVIDPNETVIISSENPIIFRDLRDPTE